MKKWNPVLTLKIFIDLAACVLAGYLAFWIRLEGNFVIFIESIKFYLLVSSGIKLFLILIFKTHKQLWRYASIQDLMTIMKLVVIFFLMQSSLNFLSYTSFLIPRSIPILDSILTLFFMGSLRFFWRLFREKHLTPFAAKSSKRILIAGAGDAGTMIAKEMLKHPEAGMVPIGFLDNNRSKHNSSMLGIPVMGDIEILPETIDREGVDEVLVAMPSAPGHVTRKIMTLAKDSGIPCRTIPGLYELVSGNVSISSIRKIEVEDLLRRDQVQLDLEIIAAYLEGKVVLVTGAGGSIGSELVLQVAKFNPSHLILVGRGENSLFNIENQLKSEFFNASFSTIVCDVRFLDKLEKVFERFKPQVVFHAAAHKHVPMMESNPEEAIFNNVGGTSNVVQCALKYNVETLVNISTDKAVNPTSIMGASTRTAEIVVRKGAKEARPGQCFISVRFGNVLGSRGSVIPIFKEQISRGGPVTVTHPEMQRYFMTIPEASQLVLQAAGMNNNGTVYVLDMGEPVKIVDLAKDLITLSGLELGEDIEITFTGIRPGEKLYEELLTAEEGTMATRHDKIFSAKSPTLPQDLDKKMETLFIAAHGADKIDIYKAFENLIPRSNFDYLREVQEQMGKENAAMWGL